jgi:uncharacterized OsmC-like protein
VEVAVRTNLLAPERLCHRHITAPNQGEIPHRCNDVQIHFLTLVLGAQIHLALAGDSCPNPMEYVLHSLASCLTSTLVYHAAVQGIEIESVESFLEGDLDVRGMLGLSEDSRKAYNAVRVRMQVKSAADADMLKGMALFSPVYDMISNSLPVDFDLVKI